MTRPSISLCMIARDEENWMGQCLANVKGLVDEVVLVDTGSKDRTIEIARQHGVRVFEEPWVDDFSIVRNISLQHAKSDWILVLDADEVIDPSDHKKIHELTKDPRFAYLLTQRHYSDDERLSDFVPCRGEHPHWEKNYRGYFESALVRLFPNNCGVHYQGRIHELAEHSIDSIKGLKIIDPGVRIHHFGHTPEVRLKKSKGRLYTPLGQVKAEEKVDDWKSYFELGVEHNNNLLYEESAAAFTKALELAPWYGPTYVNFGYVLCQLARYDQAESILIRGLQLFPEDSEGYCNLGVVKLRRGQPIHAAHYFRQAVALVPNYVNALRNLGIALAQSGQFSEAVLVGRRILYYFPDDVRALQFLASVYLVGKMPKAALNILAHLYREGKRELDLVLSLHEAIQTSRDAVDGIRFLQAHLGRSAEQLSAGELHTVKRQLDKASVQLFLAP